MATTMDGQTEATLNVLRMRAVPEWFHDAKLGVMITWGLYSVPAWAPLTGEIKQVVARHGRRYWYRHNGYAEWYANSLRIPGSPTQQHHRATYGDAFTYDEFAPRFNEAAQGMNADAWADLCVRIGARYAVLVTKHHDGFALWPSQVAHSHRQGFHATRDLVGDVTSAMRARGLRMGLYYSGGIDWTFRDAAITDLASLVFATPQTPAYAAYAEGQVRELIRRYAPSMLWNDLGFPAASDLNRLFAEYYAAVPDGLVNDRFWQIRLPATAWARGLITLYLNTYLRFSPGRQPPPPPRYDFRTPEYTAYATTTPFKWEATRGLGYSFGYNRQETAEQTLSGDELIRTLVEVVSKNGNLLINIGPTAEGIIPDIQQKPLLALGRWLATNGEAIYASRPWRMSPAEGPVGETPRLWFTQRGDAGYVFFAPQQPAPSVMRLSCVASAETHVALLGDETPLHWTQHGAQLVITLPSGAPATSIAVLRISPRPT